MKIFRVAARFREMAVMLLRFWFCRRVRPCARKVQEAAREGVLIAAPPAVGDFVMFLVALKALRESLPGAQIVLWVVNHELSVLVPPGWVDQVLTAQPRASFPDFLKWIRRLRQTRCRVALNCFTTDDIMLPVLRFISPVRYLVGLADGADWTSAYGFLYDLRSGPVLNQTQRGLALVSDLVGREVGPLTTVPTPLLEAESVAYDEIKAALEAAGVAAGRFVVLQPGSSSHQTWKRWPIERYAVLVSRIRDELGYDVVITGTCSEQDLADRIASLGAGTFLNWIGRTSLRETVALIKLAALVIGNDSSFQHLAAAVGTPGVTIYGPTDVHRTRPPGLNVRTVVGEAPCSPCFTPTDSSRAEHCGVGYLCLKSVSVARVMVDVKALLQSDA
jgi:heptosyltransferase II